MKPDRIDRKKIASDMEARALKAESLAREAGEILATCFAGNEEDRKARRTILTKLRAAGLLKGGE